LEKNIIIIIIIIIIVKKIWKKYYCISFNETSLILLLIW
jgi:hypothetical protein